MAGSRERGIFLQSLNCANVHKSQALFSVAQTVKNLPAVQETQLLPLCGESPLEKGMPTHSSFLAWRIPWTQEPRGRRSMASQRVRHA